MKLWLLRPANRLDTWVDPWLDMRNKMLGTVVRATSEEGARELASKHAGQEEYHSVVIDARTGQVIETGNPWLNPGYTTCVELNAMGESKVIIVDFFNG